MSTHSTQSSVLPLRPVDLQILLVLVEGDLHGYGLMKEVEIQSNGKVRLEVGSLYRVLGRLLDQGLIADDGAPPVGADTRRGKAYRITDVGIGAARAEAQRLEEVLESARARLAPGTR